MNHPVPESMLTEAGVAFDPTTNGRERYSHTKSGRACVHQPFMSDARFAAELERFCADAKAGVFDSGITQS